MGSPWTGDQQNVQTMTRYIHPVFEGTFHINIIFMKNVHLTNTNTVLKTSLLLNTLFFYKNI